MRGLIQLGLYRLLALALTPLWMVVLLARLLEGKEDPDRFLERLGWPTRRRPPGPLIWFHAASVGELKSLLPVFRQLEQGAQPGCSPVLLITTVTRSSADLAERVLPAAVIHQYVPIDHWVAMLPFRWYWRPCLGVLAEAELWPELVMAMPGIHIINARMSERSFRRHQRLRWYAAWLLSRVELCVAQSQNDAERFRCLGARDVRALGSTKLDADPPQTNAAHLRLLHQVFAGRSVLLLASSHPGEEQKWLEAWCNRNPTNPSLGLLVVPRHPRRAAGLCAQARALGLTATLWSELTCLDQNNPSWPPDVDVLVGDVIGEMGTWISAAAVVVMGGSYLPMGQAHGGQNPLEPASLGRPVLCGPDMANFSELLDPLLAAGVLQQHADVDSSLAAALPLLQQGSAVVSPSGQTLPLGSLPRGPSAFLAKLLLARVY